MPIEIKELHIRVAVNTPSAAQQAGGGAQRPAPMRPEDQGKKKEEMMTECIEQVLQILENKTER